MTAKAVAMSLHCLPFLCLVLSLVSELFLAFAALSPQKQLAHLQALPPAAALPELRAAHLQVADDKSESHTKRMIQMYAARERLSVLCVRRSVKFHDENTAIYSIQVFFRKNIYLYDSYEMSPWFKSTTTDIECVDVRVHSKSYVCHVDTLVSAWAGIHTCTQTWICVT